MQLDFRFLHLQFSPEIRLSESAKSCLAINKGFDIELYAEKINKMKINDASFALCDFGFIFVTLEMSGTYINNYSKIGSYN